MDIYEQFLKREPNRESYEVLAQKLGEEFVQDFPVERIMDLSLDEYMLAKKGYGNPHSFCRRLRYDLQHLASMGNAWPDVFGVYLKNGYEISLSKGLKKAFGDNYKEAFDYTGAVTYSRLGNALTYVCDCRKMTDICRKIWERADRDIYISTEPIPGEWFEDL